MPHISPQTKPPNKAHRETPNEAPAVVCYVVVVVRYVVVVVSYVVVVAVYVVAVVELFSMFFDGAWCFIQLCMNRT